MKTRIVILIILSLFLDTLCFGQVELKEEERKRLREARNSQNKKEDSQSEAWKEKLVWGGNAFATFKPVSIDG